MNEVPGRRRLASDRRHYLLLAVALVLALAARVFAARQLGLCAGDPDAGIARLMSRHIAEGRAFPVFFYGQHYLGSLEPALGAFFCLLMGPSGFAVGLGTAFVSLLAIPLTYFLGRMAGGKQAGLAAAIFMIIGPLNGFYYQVLPRGGYGATMFFAAALLCLSALLAVRETTPRARAWLFLLLGLTGGLAWWQHPLIVAALLACAVFLLAILGKKCFPLPFLTGMAGFLAGSAPFWIWNFSNRWQSLVFLTSHHQADHLRGIRLFLFDRMLLLFGVAGAPLWRRLPVMFSLMLLALFFGIATARGIAGRRPVDKRVLVRLLLALFVAVSAFFFARSSFAAIHTPRYLMPLIPALAVIAAAGAAGMRRRLTWAMSWLAFIVLTVFQFEAIPTLIRDGRARERKAGEIQRLGDYLRRHEVDVLYGLFHHHGLNFALQEEFCFHAINGERYPPYRRAAEEAERIAVYGNAGRVSDFMTHSGGSAVRGRGVHHDLTPPGYYLHEIPHVSVSNLCSNLHGELLTDNDLATSWRGKAGKYMARIDVPEASDVAGIRFISSGVPLGRMTVRVEKDGLRETIVERALTTGFFWSGPRVYFADPFYRHQLLFLPVRTKTLFLELEFTRSWELSEIQLLRRGGARSWDAEAEALEEVFALLREKGLNRLYADRWLHNAARNPFLARDTVYRDSLRHIEQLETVVLDGGSALLVKEGDADITRRSLRKAGTGMQERRLGPWILFYNPRDQSTQEKPGVLVWAGFACFYDSSRD